MTWHTKNLPEEISIVAVSGGVLYDFPIVAKHAFLMGTGQLPIKPLPCEMTFRTYKGNEVTLMVEEIWIEFPFFEWDEGVAHLN